MVRKKVKEIIGDGILIGALKISQSLKPESTMSKTGKVFKEKAFSHNEDEDFQRNW